MYIKHKNFKINNNTFFILSLRFSTKYNLINKCNFRSSFVFSEFIKI